MKYSVTTKSSMCSLFSTLREPSVNRKDLQALTLVGPTRKNPELTPPPSDTTPRQPTIYL